MTKIYQLKPNKKQKIDIILNQNGQQEELRIYFIGKKDEKFELSTLSQHKALYTTANTIIRGVLYDNAMARLNGMIKIMPKAQNTNAFLEQKILLIGDNARAEAQPMLEIEADEVKASHSATVSRLDENQIFYLMSRGVDRSQAIKILVNGFLSIVKY